MNIDKILIDKKILTETKHKILNEYGKKLKDAVKIIFSIDFF